MPIIVYIGRSRNQEWRAEDVEMAFDHPSLR